MAASLPGLPMELLLTITECETQADDQKWLLATLCALCRELNNRLRDIYGIKYCRHVDFRFNQAGVDYLQALSAGRLQHHPRSVRVRMEPYHVVTARPLPDPPEAGSSKDAMMMAELSKCCMDFEDHFDDLFADFIDNGCFFEALCGTLSRLPKLTRFTVVPPTADSSPALSRLEDARCRWTVVTKSILAAVCAEGSAVQELSFTRKRADKLSVPLSAFDAILFNWSRRTMLTKLQMVLEIDVSESMYPMYIRILSQLFIRSPALIDIDITFKAWAPDFFQNLASTLPRASLQCLRLSFVKTQFKYLARFLRLYKDTLRKLELVNLSLTGDGEEVALFKFLGYELQLLECVVKGLNVNDAGISFLDLYRECPEMREMTIDEEVWVLVSFREWNGRKLELGVDNGDDVAYWLRHAIYSTKTVDAWTV